MNNKGLNKNMHIILARAWKRKKQAGKRKFMNSSISLKYA
jgi:hypothetical protein